MPPITQRLTADIDTPARLAEPAHLDTPARPDETPEATDDVESDGYPGQVYGPARPPIPRRRSRPKKWPVALAMVIVLLLGGGYAVQRSGLPWALPQLPGATQSPTARSTTISKNAGEVGALAKGLVLINTTMAGGGRASGTGMIITPDGRVLTNYHVVRGSGKISAVVATSGKEYTAKLIGHDYQRDVAVLQLVDAKGLDVVVLDTDEVKVDDPVIAVGNTQGKGTLTATEGTVKALDQTVTIEGDNSSGPTTKIEGMIVSSVAAEPGDSGGPTYDAEGQVIGVTSAGASNNDQSEPSGTNDGSEPITFTIPIAVAMSVVDEVLAGNQTTTIRIGPNGFLGVSVGKVSNGIKVVSVTPGSPAEKVGVVKEDVISSVNGTTMHTPSDLTRIMQTTDPGEELTITWIVADGSGTRTETVILAESPWN